MTPSHWTARRSKLPFVSSFVKAFIRFLMSFYNLSNYGDLFTSSNTESSTTSTNPPTRLPLSAPTIVETPVFIRRREIDSSPEGRSDDDLIGSSEKNCSRASRTCVGIGLEPLRTMRILESGLIRFVLRPMAE